jgi:Cytochrome c553
MNTRALNLSRVALPLLVLSLATGAAQAADMKMPAKVQVCGACHGTNGVSRMPTYPDLGGQYETYIAQALHEYKDGQRSNPIMKAQAAGLSDAEITKLAEWYSSQKPVLYTPSITRPFTPKDASGDGKSGS